MITSNMPTNVSICGLLHRRCIPPLPKKISLPLLFTVVSELQPPPSPTTLLLPCSVTRREEEAMRERTQGRKGGGWGYHRPVSGGRGLFCPSSAAPPQTLTPMLSALNLRKEPLPSYVRVGTLRQVYWGVRGSSLSFTSISCFSGCCSTASPQRRERREDTKQF